jgi:DNA (cytosine-5)-methyltransferase 1
MEGDFCVVNSTSNTAEEIEKESSPMLYDHVCAPLSDFDMEVVRSIPSGGDWRDLPEATIAKSARLRQIRKSGGRTTYYGRLDEAMPSYTISTYFNRPGNGTFIHPTQDRLISLREAARLQSFPDRYRFMGSFSSKFKQIGNAVPPLLGKAIGERIKKGRCIDLFCGAGGLSHGLVQAGHKILLATDFNKHMCESYQVNHEQTLVVRADIFNTQETAGLVGEIEHELRGRTLHLLAGGPPCQGFSTAGKWSDSDIRNTLIFRTHDLIHQLVPENILLENVPGMRWMKQGKLLETLLTRLGTQGYHTQVFLLKAEEYGVPQRRRRIFIVGNRSGDTYERPTAQLSAITLGRKRENAQIESNGLPSPISVSEAISDLPEIESGGGRDAVEYDLGQLNSDYQRYMRGQITVESLLSKRTE